eukprot:NODE_7_length_67686_cov_1.621421.p22 type:complete len:286 gc:universal NODE_7_length_67686_cov_1.621421:4138-4995(+)
MNILYALFGIPLLIEISLVALFFSARGNFEIMSRSIILTVFGGIFLILSQISLMLNFFDIPFSKYPALSFSICFSIGSTLIYWRNLRLKIIEFKLDPLFFQPTVNKIEHTGLFFSLIWKRLLAFFMLQSVWILEIYLLDYPFVYQGAQLLIFGFMNIIVLYHVRVSKSKDKIKIRQELLEFFIFCMFTGIFATIDGAFMLSTERRLYNSSIWFVIFVFPVIIGILTLNSIFAAYQHVKLEKSIKNNFDCFAYVMTNEILYIVLFTNVDVQGKSRIGPFRRKYPIL